MAKKKIVQPEMVSLEDFLKDPKLVTKLENKIYAYQHRTIPEEALKFGAKFKRTPEDSIIEANNFNANWFIEEFTRITNKASTQPRAIRACVETYVVTCMQEIYYENLHKKTKEENGK